MGWLRGGIHACRQHHGKAQCRDPEVHRASWEGKVQGSRGAQGIMGSSAEEYKGAHGLMGTLRRISKLGGS